MSETEYYREPLAIGYSNMIQEVDQLSHISSGCSGDQCAYKKCVCVRERERERERGREYVCVREKERERMCVCERERERENVCV